MFSNCLGSEKTRSEFLHVDDMADACLFLMENYNDGGILNFVAGQDITINDLAKVIRKGSGYNGRIQSDTSKPDGTTRKLLDMTRLTTLGWRAKIPLSQGVNDTVGAFEEGSPQRRFRDVPPILRSDEDT